MQTGLFKVKIHAKVHARRMNESLLKNTQVVTVYSYWYSKTKNIFIIYDFAVINK